MTEHLKQQQVLSVVSHENTAHDQSATEHGKPISRSFQEFLCNVALKSIMVYMEECDLGPVQLHFNSNSTS